MTRRILVVQLADIGDMVTGTPGLAALREAQPDAHIALLTSTHAARVVDPVLVDAIIPFDRQQFNSSKAFFRPANLRWIFALGRYDTVVYFHHFTLRLGTLKFALIALATRAGLRIGLQNGNGWFLTDSIPDGGFGQRHQAQYWLDVVALLGADSSWRPPQVAVAESALVPVHRPTVVIHAGSGGYSRARRWEPAKFAAVAAALQAEYDAQIVLVGGPNDDGEQVRDAMDQPPLDLTGQTTLAELVGVIRQADLFIGADSGVMHLASAAGTPAVAIFGPSNHDAWRPWSAAPTAVVRSGVLCSPCSYVGHGVGLREGCPARTCMRLVTPDDVLQAARELLVKDDGGAAVKNRDDAWRTWERIRVLDIPVDAITYPELLATIGHWIESRQPHQICTTNPEFIMTARRDPNFYNILQRAHICIPDGVGLLWAARRAGTPLPQRVTGSDGVPIIAERAAQSGWTLFLLGAAPGVADRAAAVLTERYPGLQIVGTYGGSPSPEEEDAIVDRVNASGADIVFVAYGAPNQDKWIARNLPRLDVAVAMGVGGTFDFIAGVIPRAPLWMQQAGIEWLYRLYLQPWRIRRMSRLPRFVLMVLRRI
jgi:N-acetylglucosaminyldiphosphoundecaprenol N-acetyl-beta-D-mannosaminyltransferase